MCFSPIASFVASAGLLPLGAIAVGLALRFDKKYLLFAAIPLIFGIQQLLEGFVWLALQEQALSRIRLFSYSYLFFAFFLWPFYIPLSISQLETSPRRKTLLTGLTVLGGLLGMALYLPVVTGYTELSTLINGSCVYYEINRSPELLLISSLVYLGVLTLASLMASSKQIKLFGVLNFLAAMVSYQWYYFAFTSVWCFFTAVLSFYVVIIVWQRRR